ncbi:hypothetical protein AB0L68_40335 [Streptomyces sp. NPDC052164]|uniref:hypothetical protein n=1 Tax=Streptomyces sp. NPDC052164 TaxID=3155529 RepID=UPI0034488BD5
MSQPEQPWQPGPNDLPFTTHLINPHGDRHLGFNGDDGRFYRLWEHRRPEPLHVGDAIHSLSRLSAARSRPLLTP